MGTKVRVDLYFDVKKAVGQSKIELRQFKRFMADRCRGGVLMAPGRTELMVMRDRV